MPWDVGICPDTSARSNFLPGFSGSSQAAACLEPALVPCLEPVHPEVARLQGRLAAAGAKFAKRAKHDTWDAKETQEKSFALFKWLGLSSEVRGTSLLRATSSGLVCWVWGQVSSLIAPQMRLLPRALLLAYPCRPKRCYFLRVGAGLLRIVQVCFGIGLCRACLGFAQGEGSCRETLFRRKEAAAAAPSLRVKGGVRLESMCAGDIPRFMVCTRARHSKAQHVCTPVSDLDSRGNLPAGFIDAEVKNRTTSYTVERKTRSLPTLAPVRGLSGKCWEPGWKASGQWMGALPSVGSDDPYLLSRGTHSAKTTPLSWPDKKGTAWDVTAFLGTVQRVRLA